MPLLKETLPETAKAYKQMTDTVLSTDNFLDLKTKELIAVVAAVLVRCQACVDLYLPKAYEAGCTREEIAEALAVAACISAGSQVEWTKI
ncbi:carboxymuconolactone decarboxylase family protein [Methanosarcina sp. DH2]|jgi:AhpD family alkylhydroperoxidase|uniref:carboxymuconolactone decarboxylase family protein n=1 Tax=Methanosarcina sp. DH2 TaxID=2605639 RepID=UPI001E592155|nr:carboxymuconolactone decarboxylase family protein [Methanosarcina sp. DH2]MCC4772046.1 carboxymuconolactone decarboxylase family protein [Methanosarcina sp. DH2]